MDSAEAIIEKIKKCLRLANKAGTEGERVAAEAAARRMAYANGINLSEVDAQGENIGKAVEVKGDKDYIRYGCQVGFAVDIIRRHFGVVIVQIQWKRKSRMQFVFLGVNINIEIAKYVYDILIREFNKAFREAKGWGLDKKSFASGWFRKIDMKLTEHPIRNDLEQFQQEKAAAEDKFKEYKSRNNVQNHVNKTSNKDAEALYRGFMAADSVSLNRPCDGRASASPFALGHTAQLKGSM